LNVSSFKELRYFFSRHPRRSGRPPVDEVTKARAEVTKTIPREVTKTTPRLAENRPIEQNRNREQHISISLSRQSCSKEQGSPEPLIRSHCNGSAEKPKADGEVTKMTVRTARNTHEAASKPRFTKAAELQRQRIAPDGTQFSGNIQEGEAWLEAVKAIKRVGDKFNPGALQKLIDEHGEDCVWFHAKWYLPRLAARSKPPDNAAALFIDCVTKDYGVNPKWLDLVFSRVKHGCFTDEQIKELPAPDAPPAEWAQWMNSFEGGSLDDVPDRARIGIQEAIKRNDLDVIQALDDYANDSVADGDTPEASERDEFEELFGGGRRDKSGDSDMTPSADEADFDFRF
jgi:hypothetical protein